MGNGKLITEWREEDVPKRRRGSSELDRHKRTFLIHLRRPYDLTFHFVTRGRILHGDFGAFADSFLEYDHRAASANRMGISLERFAGNVNDHRHAHQHPLRAATLFRGGLPCNCRPRRRVRHCRLQIRCWRLHSSRPQKSMAGATSSTPYSQPPSGRWSLFHTTTAAMLVFMGTLVSATRCSSGRSCSRTTMQP